MVVAIKGARWYIEEKLRAIILSLRLKSIERFHPMGERR
jgi:hypothetical protein